MEKSEVQDVTARLINRQSVRNIDAQFGLTPRVNEEFDRYEVLSVMGEAYEGLTLGIHENVQAWSNDKGQLLQKVVTPTVYINGRVANTKTEFLLSSHNVGGREKHPDYVETYIKARDAVYEELMSDAMQTDDFEPLLGVIATYKESTLARRLLNELHAKKERYPDMIAGNADMILRRIDSRNSRIEGIKQSSGQYALTKAKREYLYEARRRLNSEETGILKAVALGLKIKFGLPHSKSKWVGILVEEQLHKIINLPTVPEQLIAKEKKGIPLTDGI